MKWCTEQISFHNSLFKKNKALHLQIPLLLGKVSITVATLPRLCSRVWLPSLQSTAELTAVDGGAVSERGCATVVTRFRVGAAAPQP